MQVKYLPWIYVTVFHRGIKPAALFAFHKIALWNREMTFLMTQTLIQAFSLPLSYASAVRH